MQVRIGTRGSALALWQADHVAALLTEAHPGLTTTQVRFKTSGDRFLDRPLAEIGGKGLFTKELEESLLNDEIDLAVHSLKDVPTALPPGLILGAIPVRADVRDCLISVGDVPERAEVVGTSSLRRTVLAQRRWPEARIEPIRGNVQTRLGRVLEAPPRKCDVVILAMAGLLRLEMTQRDDGVSFLPLNPEQWIPAVGQGALAIEVRANDHRLRDLLAPIHHAGTAACVAAERAFLRSVEGDCRVPVGAYATHDAGTLRMRAFVGHTRTHDLFVHTATGTDPEALGAEVAAVLAAGGAEALRELRA